MGILDIEVGTATVARLPGCLITKTNNDRLWYTSIGDIQFDEKVNKQILQASKVITHQTSDYFKLGVDDIPCILLLSKGNPEPFVILTKGEADIQAFYVMLKDLRKIADSLPDAFDLDLPLKTAHYLMEEGRLAEAKSAFKKADLEVQEAREACVESLHQYGMSSEVSRDLLTVDASLKSTWHVLGRVHAHPQPEKARAYNPIFRQALQDTKFQEQCRRLNFALKKRYLAQNQLTKCEGEARALQGFLAKRNFRTVEAAINSLCKKFEHKFVWRARMRPLRDVLEKLMIGGKTVKELIDLEENIKKLVM